MNIQLIIILSLIFGMSFLLYNLILSKRRLKYKKLAFLLKAKYNRGSFFRDDKIIGDYQNHSYTVTFSSQTTGSLQKLVSIISINYHHTSSSFMFESSFFKNPSDYSLVVKLKNDQPMSLIDINNIQRLGEKPLAFEQEVIVNLFKKSFEKFKNIESILIEGRLGILQNKIVYMKGGKLLDEIRIKEIISFIVSISQI